MTQVPVKVVKTATQITDPRPNFVSLVKAGANQTPFLIVKFDEANPQANTTMQAPAPLSTQIQPPPQSPEVKHVAKTDLVPAGVTIQKAVFTGENFATEALVDSFLQGQGFTDYKIEKTDDTHFVVIAKDESLFESIAPISLGNGASFFVGVLKNAENSVAQVQKSGDNTPAPTAPMRTRETPVTPPAEPAAPAAEPPPAAAPVTEVQKTEVAPTTTPVIGGAHKEDGEPYKVSLQIIIKKDGLDLTRVQKDDAGKARAERIQKVDYYMAYYESNGLTIADVLADANDGLPVGYNDVYSAFEGALANIVLSGKTDGLAALFAEFASIVQSLVSLTLTQKSDHKEDTFKAIFKSDKEALTRVMKGESAPAPATADPVQEMLARILKGQETLQQELKQVSNRVATVEETTGTVRKSAEVEAVLPTAPASSTQQAPAQPAPLTRLQKNELGMR